MEKKRKWQFFLILTVIALTIYNILPTVFYYCQPLKSPVGIERAEQLKTRIADRVNELHQDSLDWVHSFCQGLQVKPQVKVDGQNFVLHFAKTEEAARFRQYLPRAGALIPFAPAQLQLAPEGDNPNEVIVQRRLSTSIDTSLFSYAEPGTSLYRSQILDRAAQIVYSLAGPSEAALQLAFLDEQKLDALALQIQFIEELSSTNKTAANRFAASFTQGPFSDKAKAIQALVSAFDSARDKMKKAGANEQKEALYIRAKNYLKAHEALFVSGIEPLTLADIESVLENKGAIAVGNRNPLFSFLTIDWETGQILLAPHTESAGLSQALINESAKISRETNEILRPTDGKYAISFQTLPECTGVLLLDLEKIVHMEAERVSTLLTDQWMPTHPDLKPLKIVNLTDFEKLPAEEKALCLVLQSDKQLRIIARGLDQIFKNYEQFPDSEQAALFNADFKALLSLLAKQGFQGYRGPNDDLIFEKLDLYQSILGASREAFEVKGTRKYASLELSTVEQRLLTDNKIDNKIHEDLIKWQDEYNSAQVSLYGSKFDVPRPTRSVFLSNLALSFKKFFRGDERKVIRWGLDLSGGKTVQIELRDAQHKIVSDENDLKQGINELYSRVNKMGVSEVAIRQVGSQIVLDFPGSQALAASELIKASSMYFHIVNEKFSSPYSSMAALTNRFLTEVWNEAIVTNKKDAESIHAIAWNHLHGVNITETAKALLQNGLVLHSPQDQGMTHDVEDNCCTIALMRGEKWYGQSHPLLIVFRNFALEGSQLEQIQPNYDPQKGNYLSFGVAAASRDTLQSWTSRYAKEQVIGTPLEEATRGNGWRMAVILNGTVISSPTLEAVLRDSASISGQFSQREVSQLAADLKAGSLTFTPHILSEKNISPELGQKDRTQGILATVIALILVVVSMVGYYRFAGLVASVAVICNLLILWATLQNIGATLSLAGIAGVILTVGMAVDANVLVFERVKEEFAISGRIKSAIAAGYEKAYSAIVDSNVTTIIAALILLNFDAGPIKGFAITLIIGIVSSMFTALFMTRYYFHGWVQNPKNTALNMADWIQAKSIDFLKHTRLAFAIAATITIVGGAFLYAQRNTILGMDFTGGYSLYLEVEPKEELNYTTAVQNALVKHGAQSGDLQIRALTPANSLRILFSPAMALKGSPFHGMALETETGANPRILWVQDVLKAEGLSITPASEAQLGASWTSVSGQMSDTMRNNALFGLAVAFFCIFVYIAFRFEYKFAAAAILCVIHDVLITLGFMGLLHAFGTPVQIDLNTVAAIMTIVGYSLNDTIIVFDRIREETRLSSRLPLASIVNHALNTTLSRTTITSGTTLLVLLALVAFGGPSIFSFALVMAIGVFFGTLSSWYIAAPLMLLFHKREVGFVVEHSS